MKGILTSNIFRVAGLWNHGLEAKMPCGKRLHKADLGSSRKRRNLKTKNKQQAEEEVLKSEENDVEAEPGNNVVVKPGSQDVAAENEERDGDITVKVEAELQDKSYGSAVEQESDEDLSEEGDLQESGSKESDSEEIRTEESDSEESLGDESDPGKLEWKQKFSAEFEQEVKTFEEDFMANEKFQGVNQSQEIVVSGSSIYYRDGKAVLSLLPGSLVVFDGCGMVSVLKGRASMLGYSLVCGMETTVYSNFKHASAVTIEPCANSEQKEQEGGLHPENEPVSDFNSHELTRISKQDMLECILEIKSCNGSQFSLSSNVTDDISQGFEGYTFRVEILDEKRLFGQVDKSASKQPVSPIWIENPSPHMKESGLEKVMTTQPLVKANGAPRHQRIQKAEDHLGSNRKKLDAESKGFQFHATRIPSSWHAAINTIKFRRKEYFGDSGRDKVAPIVVICGAKGTGKSTFARFLVNDLLNSHRTVGYLDTDVGQPEFTIPGCISLNILQEPILGSPILHLQTPEKFYFYGDISAKADPTQYSCCILDLYNYFRSQFYDNKEQGDQMPLIINTHGWVKGIGLDVLISILRTAEPTHVVHLVSRVAEKNIPSGRFWQMDNANASSTQMISIESHADSLVGRLYSFCNSSRSSGKSAIELRALRILAYFQKCHFAKPILFPFTENYLYAETAKALACQTPYHISLSNIKIVHLHCQVPDAQSLYSINAALVGLAQKSPQRSTPDGAVLPPECLGFGIVRGVDFCENLLYLVTPLSIHELQSVDIILHGHLQIPVPLLHVETYVCPYLSRSSVIVEGTGSAVMKSHKTSIKPQLNGSF